MTEGGRGLVGVPLALTPLARADFASDAEVRWCPGCGDYSILATFLGVLPTLGLRRENTVIVSGIGCSSRFPYYVDTYGFHSIHGRAPAIATGLAVSRPDLNVWVMTGDGDALSIGGNHLIHALRRNVNLTIVVFNNRIYGLTKGQYSPTSLPGTLTKSSPRGSVDAPFNPLSLALGAEATFVARALDTDRAGLTEVLTAAARHRGAAFVEILQNCLIFNDGTWAGLKGPAAGASVVPLRAGEPITTADGNWGSIRAATGDLAWIEVGPTGLADVLVHDPARPDPSLAFALSRLPETTGRTPLGILRSVERPTYDDAVRAEVTWTADRPERGAALQRLLIGPDPWTIE